MHVILLQGGFAELLRESDGKLSRKEHAKGEREWNKERQEMLK